MILVPRLDSASLTTQTSAQLRAHGGRSDRTGQNLRDVAERRRTMIQGDRGDPRIQANVSGLSTLMTLGAKDS